VNYIASLSQAEAAKTIVWLALFSIAVDVMENEVLTGESEALSPVGKVNIPASGFATNPPDEGCDGTEEVTQNSVSPVVLLNLSTQLTSFQPLCLNSDCQGEATGLCTMVDQIASRGYCTLTFSRNPTPIALVFSPFLGVQELNPGTKVGQTFNSSGCLMFLIAQTIPTSKTRY
jgi:hypothetical protein